VKARFLRRPPGLRKITRNLERYRRDDGLIVILLIVMMVKYGYRTFSAWKYWVGRFTQGGAFYPGWRAVALTLGWAALSGLQPEIYI
jgi:hypothetical protein